MLALGLTGGIGAGKSAVTGLLVELGAAVIDADVVAREVVLPGTPGLAAVVDAFGPEVLRADGALDRPALGQRVFGDDEARRRLNAIVHPLVGRRTLELWAQADGADLLVHDVPLLVENGLAPRYHLVAVVHAPAALRLTRLERRGLPPHEARARMRAQATAEQRRAVADVEWDNSGSPADLARAVRAVHGTRLLPFARNLATGRAAPRPGVALVDPDPAWAAAGARLVARLRHVCPGATDVQHLGSTAVPGLRAKDVIDLQVEVPDRGAVEALAPALLAAGFPRREDVDSDPVRPEIDPDPAAWRKRLHRSADPGRAANVHVRVAGTAGGRAMTALRDLLRSDAAARAAYEAEKVRLAALHPADVDAYAEGKTAVLLPLLVRALRR